jgi:hypothetical protein
MILSSLLFCNAEFVELMIDPPVAGPAVPPLCADAGYHLPVTADAVLLYDFFRMARGGDIIGVDAAEKEEHVLGSVDALPYKVVYLVVVGKVAVDAPDAAVYAGKEPDFIFSVHHVAGIAECGRRCLFDNAVGGEGDDKKDDKYRGSEEKPFPSDLH